MDLDELIEKWLNSAIDLREAERLINLLITDNRWVEREKNSIQAKLDAVMLEYCPDEMTPEQLDEWAKHQKPRDMSLPPPSVQKALISPDA